MGGKTAEQPGDGIICKDTGLTGWKEVPGGIQDQEKSSSPLKPLSGFTEGMNRNLIREALETLQRRHKRGEFR